MIKIAAGIIAILLVCLAFRSTKHTGVALGLVWCLYAMEQVLQAGFSVFVTRGYLINVTIFGVSAFATLTLALRTKMYSGIRFPPQALWAALLCGLVIVSCIWSPNPQTSALKLKEVAPYMAQFALLAPLCILDRNQLEKAIKVLMYFGFFVLIGLALAPVDNRAIVVGESGGELVKGNPLAVAGFAGCVLLAAVFKIYGMKKRSGGIFLFHVGIVALGLLVLARSGSRGQVVASVIAMVIWLPITARVAAKRSSVLALGTVLLFCMGMYYFVSNGADVGRWQADQLREHSVGRLDSALALLNIQLKAGPIYWLIGLGSSASWSTIGGYPHVVPLEVFAEEGILGFAFFIGFCVSTTFAGIRVLRSDQIDVKSRVNLGLVLAIFTFQVALSFKQGSLIGSSSLFGYGLTAAWFMAYLKKEARRNRLRRPLPAAFQNAYPPQFINSSDFRRQ